MIKLIPALSASTLLLASVAAQATDTTPPTDRILIFDRISRVEHSAGTVLTGVLVGDPIPSTITVPASDTVIGNRCAKHYDRMLEQQGVYTLTLTIRTTLLTGP